MRIKSLAIVFLAALVYGCTTTGSAGIETGSLFVEYQVARHGDRVTAQATFHVGNGNTGTYVRLDEGDEVLCNQVPLEMKSSVVGQVWYEGELPAASTPFAFELRRASGSVDTLVDAPAAFRLVSPTTSTTVSASEPLAVAWSPSGTADRIDISIQATAGACTKAIVAADLPDSGSASISGSSLASADGNDCAVELLVSRSSETSAAPEFQGARLITYAYDAAEITVQP